jgi:hypothetical protein
MSEKPVFQVIVPQPTGSGVRRKVVVMLDGIYTVEFFLKGMNLVWFDRWILMPILSFILINWLKWTGAGGKIEFTYFPEEGLRG